MIPEEKKAYDECMSEVELPDRDKFPVKYMKVINECYNSTGKLNWNCRGDRRNCDVGLCCGIVRDPQDKFIEEICYFSDQDKKADNNFLCNPKEDKDEGDGDNAKKLSSTIIAIIFLVLSIV